MSTRLAAAALALTLGVTGCATVQNPDPLEPLNRKVFGFNDAVDTALIVPVAKGYDAVTPQVVQTGVTNFIRNIKDVWSAVNLFLQGRVGEGAQEILRVGINTTMGLGGLLDIATELQLDRHDEDFGQTLAVWGVPNGAYVVLPFLGPSTARDTFATPLDMYVSPTLLFSEPADANAMRALNIVNTRARLLGATDLMGDVALDKYAFIRDAWLQRRRSQIYNGDPPDLEDEQSSALPLFQDLAGVAWLDPQVSVTWSSALPQPDWQAHARRLAVQPRAQVASLSDFPVMPQAPVMTGPTPEEMAGLREALVVR